MIKINNKLTKTEIYDTTVSDEPVYTFNQQIADTEVGSADMNEGDELLTNKVYIPMDRQPVTKIKRIYIGENNLAKLCYRGTNIYRRFGAYSKTAETGKSGFSDMSNPGSMTLDFYVEVDESSAVPISGTRTLRSTYQSGNDTFAFSYTDGGIETINGIQFHRYYNYKCDVTYAGGGTRHMNLKLWGVTPTTGGKMPAEQWHNYYRNWFEDRVILTGFTCERGVDNDCGVTYKKYKETFLWEGEEPSTADGWVLIGTELVDETDKTKGAYQIWEKQY